MLRYMHELFVCGSRNDEELNKVFEKVTIAEGGVLPGIHSVLLQKHSAAAKALRVAGQLE
jgi:histone H2A